jgi:small-conductance mechanosensitive channel
MEPLADLMRAAGLERAADLAARLALPGYAGEALALLAALATALLLHGLVARTIRARMAGRSGTFPAFLRRIGPPARLVIVVLALSGVVPAIDLPAGTVAALERVAVLLLIVAAGWTLIALVDAATARALRRFRIDTEDNLRARKYATQLRVLRRAAMIVIGLVTGAAALLTFESVRQYGVSLFASAGAAGLILGLAARPVLANLIAGVQIALTQPIRLEDAVIVEGEWGWVEEIFSTYVVVRIWDWRRMVVPLSYFIEKPFQNWTRESGNVIGSVFWYVDYTVPMDAVRAKMEEIVRNSDLWDGQVVVLQVTDTDKDTMTLRGLMSARTSPRAWDLRCEVREKLLVWLQAEYPGALPRLRGELDMRTHDNSGKDGASP